MPDLDGQRRQALNIPEEFYTGISEGLQRSLRARVAAYESHLTVNVKGRFGHLIRRGNRLIGTVSNCVWCKNMPDDGVPIRKESPYANIADEDLLLIQRCLDSPSATDPDVARIYYEVKKGITVKRDV
jgi:hypothetical protein